MKMCDSCSTSRDRRGLFLSLFESSSYCPNVPRFVISTIRHFWVPDEHMNLKGVECEVERLLAVIGGKWKVLILRELFAGPRRHAQLCKALPGISQKVLTAQLRELELDGAVERKQFAGKRPHVEYSLTAFGEKLRGLILEM